MESDPELIYEEGELQELSDSQVQEESHYGGVDPGNSALGEFLESQSEVDAQSMPHNNTDDDFLNDLADLSGANNLGQPVKQPVAKLFTNYLSKDFTGSSIKSVGDLSQTAQIVDKFNKYSTPENIKGLLYCKVNDGVFKAMSPTAKRANADLQLAEAAVCKALTAEATVFDKLSEIKSKITDPILRSGFNEIFSLLADSVEFCAFTRSKINESRRTQILNSLNENYKHLISETKPENGLLFGNNLENAMKTVEQTNKLSRKLAPSTSYKTSNVRSFLGRHQRGSRGRGMPNSRYNPYHKKGTTLQHTQADKTFKG